MSDFAVGFLTNRSCTLGKIPLRLDCGISIGSFDPEHFGRILRFDSSIEDNVSIKHKSVVIDLSNEKINSASLDLICNAL